VEDAGELDPDPEEDEDSDELGAVDELGVDELLLLSLLLSLEEPSPLDLLSEFPLLSAWVVELLTSVFSPLFSGLALGSLSLSE
jgi:hypothetical protein